MQGEDLGSKSVPLNPLQFSIPYRMKLVEQIGSGIRCIRDACGEHGAAEPELHVSADLFTVTLARAESASPNMCPHKSNGLFRQSDAK